MTGVRWSESAQRKTRGSVEIAGKTKKQGIVLNADNDESRKMIENCAPKSKRVLNPIIDWTDDDVWEFLTHYATSINPLYGAGFKRVGCIGCPMAGEKRYAEFEIFPKYKDMYIRAFARMVRERAERDIKTDWRSGEEVFEWWMWEKNQEIILPGQMEMFEGD